MKKTLTLVIGLVLALSLSGCSFNQDVTCDPEEDEDCFIIDDGDEDDDSGEEETTPTPVHDYQYVETIAPTCTVIGYDVYECTICGAQEGRNRVSPLGHEIDYTTYYFDSSVHYCPCIRCDEKFAITQHDLVQVLDDDPTCVTLGVVRWECSVCDYWREIYTDMVDHVYDLCHSTVILEPGCTTEGQREYTCVNCGGAPVVEDIAPLGHTFSDDSAYAANTTHHWKLCDRCGGTDLTDSAACYESHTMVDYSHDFDQDEICYYCHWDKNSSEIIENPEEEYLVLPDEEQPDA
ncbi:MAG: hypothetical protein LUC31_00150 [Coprobacillus sp.]|nr:hypothetical protein [Coprobacillus sp.]